MALPIGQISMSQVNTELGLSSTATISLNQANVRALAGVPSGAISMNNLRGKSSDPRTKGLWAGGITRAPLSPASFAYTSHISGIAFSNDTYYNPAVTLADGARGQVGGTFSTTKGYFGGGSFRSAPGPDQIHSSIDGIIFSNNTSFNPAATLGELARYCNSEGAQSSTKGYFVGWNGTTPNLTNRLDGILFSNDTAFNPAFVFVEPEPHPGPAGFKLSMAGLSSSTKGYFCGGVAGFELNTQYSSVEGILFSNDTSFNPAVTLSDGVSGQNSGVSSSTKGYIGGGVYSNFNVPPGQKITTELISVVSGILFSNETSFNPSATLADGARANLRGTMSNSKGYWGAGGGFDSFVSVSSVDGILFSNDSAFNPSATLAENTFHDTGAVSGTGAL